MSSTVICLNDQFNSYSSNTTTSSSESLSYQKEQSFSPITYFVGPKIGSGKTSDVFQASVNDQVYALKNYKEKHMKFMKNEIGALQNLAHPNIIEYVCQASENRLMLEYCANGEVFDYIAAASQEFPAELSRFYALQLSQAVAYMHKMDQAHLDLKLENCLFDEEFNLKLADFGFSVKTGENKKEKKYIGTHRYMSPEIENSTPYDAKKADVFALGCVIFILELGFQPIYEKAVENDKYYQYFAYNQLSTFWKWLEKQYNKQFNSDFKDLISKMMCLQPENRISMEEVLNHKYFRGLVYDRQSRINYMSYLKTHIKSQ